MRSALTAMLVLLASLMMSTQAVQASEPPNAREFMAAVIDESRGQSSYAELTMTITRPDWERTSKLVAWTKGRDKSLVRFTAPPREAGNAFLTLEDRIWTWSARIGRRIRLPTSLMSAKLGGKRSVLF